MFYGDLDRERVVHLLLDGCEGGFTVRMSTEPGLDVDAQYLLCEPAIGVIEDVELGEDLLDLLTSFLRPFELGLGGRLVSKPTDYKPDPYLLL